MDGWNEHLFDNLSRLVANERKSKAASVSPVRSIVNPDRIPIAVRYAGMTGLVTGKAASVREGRITERIEGNKRDIVKMVLLHGQ